MNLSYFLSNLLSPTCASRSPDLFPVRERIHDSDLDPPALPPRAPLLRQPSPSLTPGVQWADLAAIQSQLQIQSQVCNCLLNPSRCVRSEGRCVFTSCIALLSALTESHISPSFVFSRRSILSPRNSMMWKERDSHNSVTSRCYKVTCGTVDSYLS